jgi:hypothetical protein
LRAKYQANKVSANSLSAPHFTPNAWGYNVQMLARMSSRAGEDCNFLEPKAP